MAFCYDTTRVSVKTDDNGPSNFDPMRCNATKCYMDHFKNHLVLIHLNNHGTLAEKKQASEELKICERKMTYWKRQPHFSQEEATRQIDRLKRSMPS